RRSMTPSRPCGGIWRRRTSSPKSSTSAPARSPPSPAPVPEPTPPHRSRTLPLYVGGFLGPFGGAVLAVLIPELRDAFDATTTEIALAVPAYLVPFALLQLISGTLA